MGRREQAIKTTPLGAKGEWNKGKEDIGHTSAFDLAWGLEGFIIRLLGT